MDSHKVRFPLRIFVKCGDFSNLPMLIQYLLCYFEHKRAYKLIVFHVSPAFCLGFGGEQNLIHCNILFKVILR
jgi:hypothetical protein